MKRIASFGKSKILYLSNNPQAFAMKFIDSVHGGGKEQKIAGSGKLRAAVCEIFFVVLEKNGVKTHYIKRLSEFEFLIRKLKMFKLEIVCRNYAAGSLVKYFPYNLGDKIDPPLVNFHLKLDPDPLLNDNLILNLNLATTKELNSLKILAGQVNNVLKTFLNKKGLILVDFKFEAGLNSEGKIIVGDEISPDSSRIWDKKSMTSLDKDLFRYEKGNMLDGYKKILKKIS